MNQERATKLALELMKLGISQVGVTELLSSYAFDEIERQLLFLPHRKAKRPGAFLIEAVRNKYSPPKEFYAPTQTHPPATRNPVDEDASRAGGPPDAEPKGHGAASPAGAPEAVSVPTPEVRATADLAIPLSHFSDGPSIGGDQQGYQEPH